eukprot:420384-Pyramimonas_sp.AAC.1
MANRSNGDLSGVGWVCCRMPAGRGRPPRRSGASGGMCTMSSGSRILRTFATAPLPSRSRRQAQRCRGAEVTWLTQFAQLSI